MSIIDRQGRTVDEGEVPASDYAHSGLAIKAPCRAATTANIVLSGEQSIDGVSVVANDRVLVKDQSTTTENGIYLASSGPWSRVTDMDGSGEITHGTQVFVTDGSTFGLTLWYVSSANPIVIDESSISFIQILGTGDVSGPASAVVGNVATFAHADGTEIQDSGIAAADLATQSFVTSAINVVKGGVSTAFDTLSEIATELALKAYSSITLTAGAGLTGGGDLSANRSFAVGAGTGITVNADDVALAAISDGGVMANISGSLAAPSAHTVTAVLDSVIGSTRGMLLVRGSSSWQALALGTNGHVLKSNGTDVVYAALAGGGDLLSSNNLSDVANASTARANLDVNLHNRIINGTFSIDQRNGGTTATTADNAYWADRWRYLGEASANMTARLTSMGRYPHNGALAFAGTTDKGGIWQIIEGINCKDLRSKAVVVSAYLQVSNTRLGNIKMGIVEFTGTEDSVSGDPISSWGADGTTPTLAANYAFLNTPANLSVTTSVVKYSVTATVGGSANNLAVFIWNDDKSYNAGDALAFAEVQFEIGSLATSFERRQFGQEIPLCQRYYQKTYDLATAPGTVTANGQLAARSPVTAGTAVDTFQKGIMTRFRTVPTVKWYSPATGTIDRFRDVTGAADVTVTGTSGNGETSSGYPTCASTPTAASFLNAHYTADAEL